MVEAKKHPFLTSLSYAPKPVPTPQFSKSIIQNTMTDGYCVETFWVDPNDKAPGLIGYSFVFFLLSLLIRLTYIRYGLKNGNISLFDNPINTRGGTPTQDIFFLISQKSYV